MLDLIVVYCHIEECGVVHLILKVPYVAAMGQFDGFRMQLYTL